jgi:hypothetical protein
MVYVAPLTICVACNSLCISNVALCDREPYVCLRSESNCNDFRVIIGIVTCVIVPSSCNELFLTHATHFHPSMGIHETQLEGLRECNVVFFNFNQLFGLVPFVT